MSFKHQIIFLILLAFCTRFIGLNWGNSFFFHPDENNMASALSQLSSENLNPHFFAYGQFPLYLGYFSLKVFNIPNTFANSILVLRLYSALFSLLSLYFFYQIYPSLIFVLLLIFTPGLIQLAHFGTTESLLILTFAVNLYLSKLILKKPSLKLFLLASINTGIALATKISGAVFILPIFFAAIVTRSWFFIPFGVLSLFFTIILSPYNILDFPDFLSSMKYETAVASGTFSVFYTHQFLSTLPYFFQLYKIFPYISGWPILLFAVLSLFFCKFTKAKKNIYFWIVFLSSSIYFLYFGQLFVKWTRFMSPLFFLPPLLASIFLKRFPKLLPLALIPGLIFMSNYFLSDSRISASNYLLDVLPPFSKILSESGNVVDLPVSANNLNINNYDFYNYYPQTLAPLLLSSDYIIVPSRRVFKNYSLNYYQHLFDGTLGFREIKRISPPSDFFLNSENAEETWTVFDRPTIRIYQKYRYLTLEEYEKLL